MGYKFFHKFTKPMRTYRHLNQIKGSIVIVDWPSFVNQHNRYQSLKNRLYVFIECFKANNVQLIFVFDHQKIQQRKPYRAIIFGMGMLERLSVKVASDQVSYLYHKYKSEGRECYVYSYDSYSHFSRCPTITGLVVDSERQGKRLGIFSYLYLPEWKDTGDNQDIEQEHKLLAKISLQPEKMDLLGALLTLNDSYNLGIYLQQWIKIVAAIQEGPPFQFQPLIDNINQLQQKIKNKTSNKEPITSITPHDIRSQIFKLRWKPIFNEETMKIEVTDLQYFQKHRQQLQTSQEKTFQLLNVNNQACSMALRYFEEERKTFAKSPKYEKYFSQTKIKVDASMKRYFQGKKIAQIQKTQRKYNKLKRTINLSSILKRGNLSEQKDLSHLKLSTVVVDSTSLIYDQLNPIYQICYTIRESLAQLNRIKQYLSNFIEVFKREKIRLIFLFDLDPKCTEAPWMSLDNNQPQVQGQEKQQPMVISHQMLLIRAKNMLMKFIASKGAEIDYAADKIEQQAVHIYRRLEVKGDRCAIYSQQHIFQIYRCRTVHSLHVQADNKNYCLISHLFLPECSTQHYTKYQTELIEVSEFKQKLYLLAAFYMANQQGKCGLILKAMTILVYCLGQQPSKVPMTIRGLLGLIAQFKNNKYEHILTEEFRGNLTKHVFRLRFGPIFNKDSQKIEALEKQAVKKYEPDEQLFDQLNKTINEFVQAAQVKYQQRKAEYQMILTSNGNKI